MNNPLVSTVITTYKRDKKYVKEAIDSVINQTYKPIEVIVVDDNGAGSQYENDLRELCSSYNGVVYLFNEKNSGAQISRNNGIRASHGEYIALLDDDDIWEKTKIEKQMALFTDEQIGMIYCDGYSFEEDDMTKLGVFREASIFDRPISHKMELFNDWIGSTSQALIRRDVFDNVGFFDPDMPARQDYEMWLRITKKYKVVGSPEKLLFYRVHPGERISTSWNKCYQSYELILEKYAEDFSEDKYAKAKLILKMFKTSAQNHKYGLAIKNFVRAFVNSPSCVVDAIKRNALKQDFYEFYNEKSII